MKKQILILLTLVCIPLSGLFAQIAIVKGKPSFAGDTSLEVGYFQNFNSSSVSAMAQSDKADVFARESNISLLGWFRDASHSEGDLYPAHPDASGNGLAVADVKIDFIR